MKLDIFNLRLLLVGVLLFFHACNYLQRPAQSDQEIPFPLLSHEITRNDTLYLSFSFGGLNIRTLPEFISNYQYAHRVGLDSEMDHEIVAKQLAHFEIIENLLFQGKFDTFPRPYTNLSSVRRLDLRRTNVKVFPEGACKMEGVISIDLSNTALHKITFSDLDRMFESLSLFQNLRYLRIHDNNLDTLPLSISKLKSLRTIYMFRNSFDAIPEVLKEMKITTIGLDYHPDITKGEYFSGFDDLGSVIINFDTNTEHNAGKTREYYDSLRIIYPHIKFI